jgi:hypothetical protein
MTSDPFPRWQLEMRVRILKCTDWPIKMPGYRFVVLTQVRGEVPGATGS